MDNCTLVVCISFHTYYLIIAIWQYLPVCLCVCNGCQATTFSRDGISILWARVSAEAHSFWWVPLSKTPQLFTFPVYFSAHSLTSKLLHTQISYYTHFLASKLLHPALMKKCTQMLHRGHIRKGRIQGQVGSTQVGTGSWQRGGA